MDPGAAKTGTTHRLLAIVTGDPIGAEPLQQIRANGHSARDDDVDLRVVVPAVEASAFRHTLGDVDEPRREAEARLGRVLEELRANGLEAAGEVGDPDPIQAAQDALLIAPAEDIGICEPAAALARRSRSPPPVRTAARPARPGCGRGRARRRRLRARCGERPRAPARAGP